jgi:hypothetical protein
MKRVIVISTAWFLIACASRSGFAGRGAPPQTLEQLRADGPSLREHCAALQSQREACARDRACVPGGPMVSCDGPACAQGGPMTCMSCLDWVTLTGRVAPEFCVHRAAGRNRTACLMLHTSDPQRCENATDQYAVRAQPST